MSNDWKKAAASALTEGRLQKLATANHFAAFPLSPQSYDLGAALPAMLYMARWGWRRGKGQFARAFAGEAPEICLRDVAKVLIERPQAGLYGFEDPVGQVMLADLLQTWCLENKRHAEGHTEPVRRVFPTHYLASWIDLPALVVNLRGVPEWLIALLADQPEGEWLELGRADTEFPVGVGFDRHPLLKLVGRHMAVAGRHLSDLTSDQLVEREALDLGIDELLVVRMAQACAEAPQKARGKGESDRIPNRHAIAKAAAQVLRHDLRVLISGLGPALPRTVFLDMMQACMGLGLTQLTLSTADVLAQWERTGTLPKQEEQRPWPLFVDASRGQDRVLRDLSESWMVESVRRFERLPVQTMLLRVLEDRAVVDRRLKDSLPPAAPDATALFNLLGDILHDRHARSEAILDALEEDCSRLADVCLETDPEAAERLSGLSRHPAARLAEVLCFLGGDSQHRAKYLNALESALMTDEPLGLAISRRVDRSYNGTRKAQDLRSIVLPSALLDALVHRYLWEHPSLSLQQFMGLLRSRHGLYIDQAPPGLAVPQAALWDNKRWLEKQLRDLGLLLGVNDAESMKQLQPRYALGARHAV